MRTSRSTRARAGLGRAVFLDRDGVLNRTEVRNGKPFAPRRLADFRLLPGAAASVRTLQDMGFLVAVVTNQPDIGNGLVTEDVVEAMHARLRAATGVDDIRVCPHSQGAACRCRKPKPGLLRAVARSRRIDLERSYMVGDRWSDIVAGHSAGCYTILVDRGYDERRDVVAVPDARVRSLREAVACIVRREAHVGEWR